MRSVTLALLLLAALALTPPAFAQDGPKPEFVAEKMAFKFARGVTNLATAVVELPKQSYLSVRDRGTVGYAIGPLKGIVMTAYRAFIGATETVFFLVPQPGYYDPMIEPDYVWKGWEEPRGESGQVAAGEQTGGQQGEGQ
ncbi:exosortase system-associated protein, TIGR04073 family [Geobacter sp.]|uniref:exosortase system-associated protein, TIGR04073 family n=1 Tax=Geobacter sp. TaxID=46610 RepID=UPI00261C5B70|nr:exosortase system-associated protein, TIGR04073 family [Geobacter sp.]